VWRTARDGGTDGRDSGTRYSRHSVGIEQVIECSKELFVRQRTLDDRIQWCAELLVPVRSSTILPFRIRNAHQFRPRAATCRRFLNIPQCSRRRFRVKAAHKNIWVEASQ
jgi:hypothetical protein